MHTFALTVLGSAVLASTLVLPMNVSSANNVQAKSAVTSIASISQDITVNIDPVAINEMVEQRIMAGGYDNFLQAQYDEGVLMAFREAYAMNVMGALWNENSAKMLLEDITKVESQGGDIVNLKPQTVKAAYARFNANTPAERAEADIALSLAYIALQNLQAPEGDRKTRQPRLASLDTKLVSAAQNYDNAPMSSIASLSP